MKTVEGYAIVLTRDGQKELMLIGPSTTRRGNTVPRSYQPIIDNGYVSFERLGDTSIYPPVVPEVLAAFRALQVQQKAENSRIISIDLAKIWISFEKDPDQTDQERYHHMKWRLLPWPDNKP